MNTAFFSKDLYIIYLEHPQGRIRKPSKRQQGLDPVIPLTPAPPKTKARSQQQIPVTPLLTSFASRQIQASRNQAAATVLFTPRTKHSFIPHHDSPSPTPFQEASQLISSSSEVEEEVRGGLERLELQSDSQSPVSPLAKHPKVKSRPKGGAKDVWNFFEKSSEQNICIICK
jgi:hypothetical protein